MARGSRIAPILAASAVALALGQSPAAAIAWRPEVVVGVGRTFGVEGEPGDGGPSLSLSLMWRLEEHFRAGVMGFADDLGDQIDRLTGPAGEDLGPAPGVHRAAAGALWRMDALVPGRGYVTPVFSATWGFYRVEDDVLGDTQRSVNAAGFGLGAGVMRTFNPRHSATLLVRFQQLSHGSTERYLSANLEWRWGLGAGR